MKYKFEHAEARMIQITPSSIEQTGQVAIDSRDQLFASARGYYLKIRRIPGRDCHNELCWSREKLTGIVFDDRRTLESQAESHFSLRSFNDHWQIN